MTLRQLAGVFSLASFLLAGAWFCLFWWPDFFWPRVSGWDRPDLKLFHGWMVLVAVVWFTCGVALVYEVCDQGNQIPTGWAIVSSVAAAVAIHANGLGVIYFIAPGC